MEEKDPIVCLDRKKRDVSKYPVHMQTDEHRRNENIDKGFPLCGRCEGTGNEFLSMYHKCGACGGTGRGPTGVTA